MFDRRLPPETFRRLIEPHTQALYRLAFRFTGRRADAEDLLQELLTRMYAKSARLANIDLLRPWLARALYNLFVDERRRNARSALGRADPVHDPAADDDGAIAHAPAADPEFAAEMTSLEREISAAVAELPAEQQQVVTLCDLEGYTLQETANILGVALGTVKSRLNRAHGRLRDRLRERNFSPGNVVLSDAAPITEPAGWATRSADDGL